jgi:hypothetical protein
VIDSYFNYDAREVALYLMGEVNAHALKYRGNPIVWI